MNKYDDEIKYLIDSYSKLLFKITFDIVGNKEETENIVQESYLSYYNNINRYNSLDYDSKRRLLVKIAINKSKDYLKSKKNYLIQNLDDEEIATISSGFQIEEYMIKEEKKKLIKKAVNNLKEPYRSLVNYYSLNDYTLDMVSEKTNTKKEVLKVQLVRAKKLLKEKLIEGGELDE